MEAINLASSHKVLSQFNQEFMDQCKTFSNLSMEIRLEV